MTASNEAVVYMNDDIDSANQRKRKVEAMEAGSDSTSSPAKVRSL